ncbi:tRNA 2-selenouridine synthase [Poseidonocella pacifica]|uniref:tRNA 2-selenouridine synthase n=1 Tax=Poseidonocella pacifica TaxID=871651 RepID=A0A1I0YH54_9RHOB|nr:tRNA 2-selenouridine(34) synthase MnmH [Poseidonocella pacifica]SFB12664.1 tRNA 2-selenouridine synthase [Poseidonocella pacifica]
MVRRFETLVEMLGHGFDTVIDVRSPAEFAEDHVPGAINLPVLDNEERARVGTIYKQESPFRARKIGAALVFRNAATHIEQSLAHHEGDWQPLVYCWRGGQRSGTLGWMLREIGWRAEVVEGGYRSYRRLVHEMLYEGALPFRIILLDGNTGTAKTDVLHRLASRGRQVLDLEGLANHRGSLLGIRPEGQPSQKMFESRIAQALAVMDPGLPILVEAESSKIGQRIIPPALFALMKSAPRIEVTAPVEARTAYLAKEYADILSDVAFLEGVFGYLIALRGRETIDGWLAMARAGEREALTRALITEHYDPAYRTSRRANGQDPAEEIAASSLDAAGQEVLADGVEAALDRIQASVT